MEDGLVSPFLAAAINQIYCQSYLNTAPVLTSRKRVMLVTLFQPLIYLCLVVTVPTVAICPEEAASEVSKSRVAGWMHHALHAMLHPTPKRSRRFRALFATGSE